MHAERPAGGNSNVEVVRELAEGPMPQHIIPPWIVLRGGHVIRNDVQQNPQSQGSGRLHEAAPSLLAAEIVADLGGVYDIVAMLAAGNRLQAGRQVNMAD